MRINTNFAAPIESWAVYMTTTFWVISAFVLFLTLWMLFDLSEIRNEIEVLRKATIALKQKTPEENVQSRMLAKNWKVAQKRLDAVRKLVTPGNTTPTKSLRKLEELLPGSVYLISLHYKQKNGEILIISESREKAALTKFLYNLEKEKRFTDVLLTKQELFKSKGVEFTRYELRLRERSM